MNTDGGTEEECTWEGGKDTKMPGTQRGITSNRWNVFLLPENHHTRRKGKEKAVEEDIVISTGRS